MTGFDPDSPNPEQPPRDSQQFRSDGFGPTDFLSRPVARPDDDDAATRQIPAVPPTAGTPSPGTSTPGTPGADAADAGQAPHSMRPTASAPTPGPGSPTPTPGAATAGPGSPSESAYGTALPTPGPSETTPDPHLAPGSPAEAPLAQGPHAAGDVDDLTHTATFDAADDHLTRTATFPAASAEPEYVNPFDAPEGPSDPDARPEDRFITGSTIDGEATAPVATEKGVAKRGFHIPVLGGWLLGIVRILVGWQFLWAFLDKTFGLGWSTPREGSWINGGSPIDGFLTGVVNDPNNPFASLFDNFLGQPWADWLFMVGLLGIGVVLIVGLGTWLTWFASICGIVMYLLMYLAAWPAGHSTGSGSAAAATNPFFDSHLLGAILLLTLAVCNAGAYLGLAKAWRSNRAVRDL